VKTRRIDLVEVLHGVPISDPYRWLEDGASDEVRAWDEEQNARTHAWLSRVDDRETIGLRIRELLAVGTVGAPVARTTRAGGRRYFHVKREGSQDQAILYVRDGVWGADRVLVDPAPLSTDAATTMDWWSVSSEGERVAWGLSEAGTEESTLRVRDVATGIDLPDRIPYTRHATVAFAPGGDAFFYTRYPAPGEVPEEDESYFCRVFYHRLGDDPNRDEVVFGEGRDRLDIPAVSLSPDGRWLVVRVHQGWQKSELWVRDLTTRAAPWALVASGVDALYEPIALSDVLYVLTNEGAPRFRLLEVDYERPERHFWREVLPERDDVLSDVVVVGGARRMLVAGYLHEASARVERFSRSGESLGAIELPTAGSAALTGENDGDEVFIEFASFARPGDVLRFDCNSGTTTSWERVGQSFSSTSDVRVSMLYGTSKDGTRIPMFVVEREGTERDGNRATVLYGYGGFNIAQTPAFSARTLLTVESGGVWVVALLRGGGEFGDAWHRAGMLERKQNTFDDLFACAEELVRARVTRPERLAVVGGSNGGLLVAAAVTQRPSMFRAALCLVPLTDMLRYHRFRIGGLWTTEYGDPEIADAFRWLRAYSPYHNVTDGVSYPSILLATAEGDSRVDPMHARKMAARLAEAQADPCRPVLLRVERRAGHGAGKPVGKLVEQVSDEMAFLFQELGLSRQNSQPMP
jgi:prolyl oligopeptidase